ncbi:MAG: BON domain-containing protein [Candidatus Rokuibacteriota bacterium]
MTRFFIALVLAGVVTAPVVAAAQAASPATRSDDGNVFKDSWLTSKTKAKLLADKRVKSLDISVETTASVVTLRGKVASFDQRSAAEQIARGVDGVRAVTNALQVVPNAARKRVDERDDAIREAVADRLARDDRLKEADIKVRIDAGMVTLMGTVPDGRVKARAVDAVRAVPGVKSVKNELREGR